MLVLVPMLVPMLVPIPPPGAKALNIGPPLGLR
jgi:hypothetical protein